MNRHFVLKAALTVALCIPPWGGVFETLTPQAKGQQTAWVVGSSQLAFSSEFNEAIVQAPLPVPNDPMAGDLQYDGTPAVRSQQLIQDQFGNLLGFLVDGSIYDRDGYRIADANPDISGYDTDDCVDCIPQGISQALVVPFPGQCYKFLVLTMVLGEGSGVVQAVRAYMALLDMSRPNAALVDLGLTDRTGALISLYPGGDADLDAFQFPTLLDGPNLFVRGLPLDVQTAFKVAGHMDAVDAGFDQEKWIFLTDGSSVTRYKLTASALTYEGFQQVPPLTQDENFQPDNWPQGELEAVRTSSEMRVAYSAHGYVFDPVTFESIHRRYIIYQRYSLSGAWLSTQRILVDEHLVDLTDPEWSRINGVEFSPNGRYVYFVKRQAPYFGYVDLEDQSVHALTADLSAYRYTQLATAPSAAEPDVLSIYAIANNGWLGALGNLDDPANLTWQPQALQLPMAPDCAGVDDAHDIPNIVGNPTDQYHMLHSGTAGYAAYGPDNAYVCCEKMSASEGFKYTAAPGSQTDWEPGDNPFLDFWSPVIIKDELRIAAGVHITASDMEFRFGPDAQLVIEPAGSFTCDHCILTSACPEIRWAGVRVEGNTTALQTTDYQGKLWLRYSTISNALTGVRCSDGSSAGYGGIVWCSYSTFSNCRTGVDIGEYHHSPGSLTVDDNNSFFSYTHFVTELPMPDTQAPWTHLYVHGTRKVRVTACSFANDVPNFFPVEQWGTGMRVYNAEIAVQGNTNPNFSYVRNLRTGIWRTGSPKMPITVDGMRFSGNRRGVHDDGGYFSRYTNNTFSIPDQGTAPTRREGMRLNQTRFFTVERNTFTGEDQAIGTDENSIGIFFLGIAPVDNGIWNYSAERIYDNTFTDLYAGTLVNNVHVSHDGFKDTEGLQILCGDYVNNVMDIALGPVSPIRSDQGSPIFSEDQQLAGNTFDHNLNPVDCDAIRDWDMDIEWNDIDPCTAMIIDYHRHEDADCAVACDSDEGSNPDLADDPLSLSGDFIKASDCGYGVLDNSHLIADVQDAYTAARALAIAARDLLEGNTNGGEKPDLLADLAQSNPWLSSSYLRDELILHSPLSDEVLDSIILRHQPMDQWHITQVMVENSPLNPGVFSLLKTSMALGPFFMNVVEDAQQGNGPSAKQLLEQEMLVRRDEQAGALALLGWMWGTDTTITTGVDSLRALFFQPGTLDFTQARIELLIGEGDFAGATAEISELRPNYSGYNELQALLIMGAAHGGDWSQLTTAEQDSLRWYAEWKVQGAGLMTGILTGNGFSLPRVDPIFPRHTRAMELDAAEPTRDSRLDAIVAYPDPADEFTRITFPAELKGGRLEVVDAQGRLSLSMPLTTFGLTELRTGTLASGAYQLRITGTTSTGRLLVKH